MWSPPKMGVSQVSSLDETSLPVLQVPVMLRILKCLTAHQSSFMEGLGPIPRATKVLLPHVAQGFSPPHCKDSCISGAAVAAAAARRTLTTNPRAGSGPEMSSRMQKLLRQADREGSARRTTHLKSSILMCRGPPGLSAWRSLIHVHVPPCQDVGNSWRPARKTAAEEGVANPPNMGMADSLMEVSLRAEPHTMGAS
ncbi:hypothetical protein S7711_10989 [Stachybotrys chartarum IBT 7711]|uniref:Uncharacterized protein n=1 Tax=Stachybotrys chartarum (strain CBS 109288 / IBT 7711) TaxID=1280523 RepID=A0A084AKL0_STACB|nr:hypothetical protein S7711_10989 [Stachybotrys chartarum IBT 7711]